MDGTLGKRITANRKRLGLTQDQLAEKLGITAQAVSKWENDLSCPDISILPKLADIFEITTDELLGREILTPVRKVTVVNEEKARESGFTYDSDSGKMDLHWEGLKLERISLACWVILTGIIYLITQILSIDVSFWNILWPSFLLVFGIFGLLSKFSVFRVGCAIVGGYFLLDKLQILSIKLNSGIILAVIILFLGLSLLAESLRKNKRKQILSKSRYGNIPHGKVQHDYTVDDDRFTYDASFGSSTQIVQLEKLRCGNISTNFGEYTVDLTGVVSIDEQCILNADCSFGELTILIPQHYTLIPDNSTSFASFEIIGQPATPSLGTIHLHADVSFGEIRVHYI